MNENARDRDRVNQISMADVPATRLRDVSATDIQGVQENCVFSQFIAMQVALCNPSHSPNIVVRRGRGNKLSRKITILNEHPVGSFCIHSIYAKLPYKYIPFHAKEKGGIFE